MSSNETVAQRYARAIFELGVESGNLQTVVEDFRRLAEVYAQSPELGHLMTSPLVGEEARIATMNDLADRVGVSALGKNALGILARRRRISALPAVSADLDRLTDEKAGVARVTVISAERLPDSYRERLVEELAAMTGKKVVLDQKLDPELLAGVVVRIGDRVIDGSARTRLAELRTQLLGT
jgi:F-type H+-transporting ATPase subunit delta